MPPAEQAVAWIGDDEFVPHMLAFLRIPRVAARVSLGDRPVVEVDRKELASRLEGEVRGGLRRALKHLTELPGV